MKRLNFIVLLAAFVGSLFLDSCFGDEKNGFFYEEPEAEIQSYSMVGINACFFICKIWPTKEMYENNLKNYECGIEYSTDSLFRSSTKVVIGRSKSDDFIVMGYVGELFPDSTYYVRALLVLVDDSSLGDQYYICDKYGNKYVNQFTHVIKEGKTVSITMPHLDVNDYVHVSVMELGTMNINLGVECECIDMTSAGINRYDCSLELSENDTFSENVRVAPIKSYEWESKFEFKSLKPFCDYYCRVCLSLNNKSVAYYGDVIKVSTLALKEVNGMQYVDLGLSVMWANCNVGAHSPLEPGGFYCWGELEELITEGMKVGDIDYVNTTINYSKYNKTDGKLVLEPEDDVATVKWGAPWHIPDKSDIEELNDNCTSRVLTIDGQKVVRYTSKINGNYITVPIAGWYSGGQYLDWDQAFFWTRTLYDVFMPSSIAYSARSNVWGLLTENNRSNCLNVRPVVKP